MMKKVLFSFLTALIASAGSLPMAAQEAYAVLTEPDSTLTFYYDNLRSTRPGTKYDIPTEKDTAPGWTGTWDSPQAGILHAVFDASFADYRPTSTRHWFQYCKKLQDIKDIRNLNTANVTDMGRMFAGCDSLASLDLTGFNTAKVTDMSYMFYFCRSLASLDLTGFNTANVTYMQDMFYFCRSLASLDLTGFNTANVTDMSDMFAICISLTSLNLTNFNTANVTDMHNMFGACSSLASLDLTGFNTANVIYMYDMFVTCSSLASLDLTSFNTANVTDMSRMFAGCDSLASLDLTGFNTANVTGMSEMFEGCQLLTTIYCNDDWSKGKVEEDENMFKDCTQLSGAVAYYEKQTGIAMANPDTGYFTRKGSGIADVSAERQAGNGRVYDLSGRLVGKNYKGVVVTNGRKILQR